jgi:hypothetical protein
MLTALHFLTHIGLSVIIASAGTVRSRKDRWLITLAGILPDLDGIGILWSPHAYDAVHRAAGHGVLFAVAWSGLTVLRADRRWSTTLLALLSLHAHLLLDLVGTDGLPIRYFWPVSSRGWSYAGRWPLASWPNALVMMLTALGVAWVAWPGAARMKSAR